MSHLTILDVARGFEQAITRLHRPTFAEQVLAGVREAVRRDAGIAGLFGGFGVIQPSSRSRPSDLVLKHDGLSGLMVESQSVRAVRQLSDVMLATTDGSPFGRSSWLDRTVRMARWACTDALEIGGGSPALVGLARRSCPWAEIVEQAVKQWMPPHRRHGSDSVAHSTEELERQRLALWRRVRRILRQDGPAGLAVVEDAVQEALVLLFLDPEITLVQASRRACDVVRRNGNYGLRRQICGVRARTLPLADNTDAAAHGLLRGGRTPIGVWTRYGS